MRNEAVVFVLLALFATFYVSSFTGLFTGIPTTHANRIIDGDTIEIAGGEKVRLIGIDTPERGQHFYGEAKERLSELIGGREILLKPDVTDKDKYGRLLRYVFLNRTELVNIMLVREGLARALSIEPDTKYEKEIAEAESYARSRGLGIWTYANDPELFCIGIYYLRYNAIGDDRDNLNDEYVEFRNHCDHNLDMTGWRVEDSTGKEYVFGEFMAKSKEMFKLRTGAGDDGPENVFWNSRVPVWNNAGDRLRMWNRAGQLVLDYEYQSQ
ncbi:MAG: hypothetical protein DRO99_01755 [Candidatus Aenigmatarchaeota archaeon]|nr:MAG: hypothetical protein DRO99_01755 [Candidatus Aenigmarchaeota archaeon]